MKKQIRKAGARRMLSLALALVLAIGIIPFMNTEAYAAEYRYGAPNYNGRFEVYSTFFNYGPFTISGGNNPNIWTSFYSPKLYMEYSADGGKTWKRSGYMQYNSVVSNYNQNYRIGGLRPNTYYKTRIYYGDDYGNPISPYRTTTTIKTGMAARPAIKKVTAKAVNVKFHRGTRPGYYYWTGYHYIWMRPVKMRYYTYNVKVTVQLKKKPGTAGIWVNGRWLPGNKKKYTTTFKIPSPHNMSAKRPRGRVKYTVSVCTGQNKIYKGYSPTWRKRMKLK